MTFCTTFLLSNFLCTRRVRESRQELRRHMREVRRGNPAAKVPPCHPTSERSSIPRWRCSTTGSTWTVAATSGAPCRPGWWRPRCTSTPPSYLHTSLPPPLPPFFPPPLPPRVRRGRVARTGVPPALASGHWPPLPRYRASVLSKHTTFLI